MCSLDLKRVRTCQRLMHLEWCRLAGPAIVSRWEPLGLVTGAHGGPLAHSTLTIFTTW
jgi:hypothetical protein